MCSLAKLVGFQNKKEWVVLFARISDSAETPLLPGFDSVRPVPKLESDGSGDGIGHREGVL